MRRALLFTVLILVSVSCADAEPETPESLRLLSHDSFANEVTDQTFAAFTEATGIEVEVIAGGDAGSMVNQAILSKDNPLADVIFGVDDTFLSRPLGEGIFLDYESELSDRVPEDLFRGAKGVVTPIDYGDVCINYAKAWFETTSTPVPTTMEQLRESIYAGTLTVEHPATSSPGLAFMLATIVEYGEEGWLEFWADLKAGGVEVVPDWDTAYFNDFVPYGGENAMVVSYASSPPAEVILAPEPLDDAPTGVIEAGCYRQVEYAGILEGTAYPQAAGELIDFMLSVDFQESIPLTWFVFPANSDANLPPAFIEHTTLPESPAQLDPDVIAENRERWIDAWVSVMEG